MKKMIALVAIAAALYAPGQPAFAEGEKFEADDDFADKMLADKVAKLDEPAAKPVKLTKARLLVDSALGKCNDVVELEAATLKRAEADGIADASKEAVAYASALPQNKPPT